MFRFFADEKPVSWVMGQTRCTGEKRGYGHVMEEHAVAHFAFEDGTRGLLDGSIAFNAHFALRLTGTEGLIDLFHDGTVRVLNSNGWQDVPTRSTLHDARTGFEAESPWLAILNALIAWIEGGPEPMVSGANAIFSSELYLAAYESARRGDRVDLPLGNQHEFPLEPNRHIKTSSPT
jgi:predicted dehydrogenase